jgi:Domain of unknown function (DUF222)
MKWDLWISERLRGVNVGGRQWFVGGGRYRAGMSFKQAAAAWDALAEHADEATELWTTRQRIDQLERLETLERTLPAMRHGLINQLAATATAEELGGSLTQALADAVRINRREANRRIHEAGDLGPRTALSGEALRPTLEHTAAGQRDGVIGREHVKEIREFFHQLPGAVDQLTRDKAEHRLAQIARQYRPDQLRRYAQQLALFLNPDGNFSDADRARKRGISIGPQGWDGMSWVSGWVNPELRAGLDAVVAKWAAPGMCNPADQDPTVEGAPPEEAINADTRTTAQRNHDALGAMVRNTLMSGELGSHQGLPVTIVVTATVEDLQAKTGMARTGGGTLLPMSDVIRMAADSYNYLLLFDKAKRCELYKGRTTRLATPAQRLVLYARERGCTHPGCDIPAYWCQVHHTKDFAKGGRTDIDEETLACGPHNRLATDGGWTTGKRPDGTTEWIPPPHLDRGQPRTNKFFHPEKMLGDDDEESGRP